MVLVGAVVAELCRGLGRLVYLRSEDEADIIAPDVNKHVDTGADATQEQAMPVQAHPHVQWMQ
jgi:hypothetical protein